MFGFVNVYKDLLRICDYNLFRGYYCGLCKRLGRHYNQFARLGLSYDMTFLAILLSALEDGAYTVKPERCLVHPLQKHPVIRGDAAIDYSADVAVMLTHLKLRDDMLDEKSVKSALADVCYVRPVRKARRQYEALYAHMHTQLLKLRALEAQNCASADAVADCFGSLLARVFDRRGDNRALHWLGYHIGRYIYIVDAFKDFEMDVTKGLYNPFAAAGRTADDIGRLRLEVQQRLTYTLQEIANAYELLSIERNKELLDNIIYMGLRKTLDTL